MDTNIGATHDILDMNNYRVEKLKKNKKEGFEKWMEWVGGPLAVVVFLLIYYFMNIDFLNNIDAGLLKGDSLKRFNDLGSVEFSRINYAMLAIFAASIVLWITEAIPNYLTSLLVIITMVLTGVTSEKVAYAQLGHPVMWLNILSFVLASMLVKTKVAKRFALWFVIRFGKNATWIFFSFIVINVVLSVFISATTAPMKATAVWEIPCCLSVAQSNSTTKKIAIALNSSIFILPKREYSCLSLSIPPSICGRRSPGFIGKITLVPTNQPMIISTMQSGNAAINQS